MLKRTMTGAEYIAQQEAQRTEKEFQDAIVKKLRLAGYTVFEFNKPGGHGPSRGSVPVGWPDLIVGKGGRCVAIELKRKGKKPTEDQLGLGDRLYETCGIPWYWTDGNAGIWQILEDAGI